MEMIRAKEMLLELKSDLLMFPTLDITSAILATSKAREKRFSRKDANRKAISDRV